MACFWVIRAPLICGSRGLCASCPLLRSDPLVTKSGRAARPRPRHRAATGTRSARVRPRRGAGVRCTQAGRQCVGGWWGSPTQPFARPQSSRSRAKAAHERKKGEGVLSKPCHPNGLPTHVRSGRRRGWRVIFSRCKCLAPGDVEVVGVEAGDKGASAAFSFGVRVFS